MKTALITTVLNEEENIDKFLESVFFQTKKPDEIIIVDGGSKDKTFEKLKVYQQKIKLLRKKGNRSVGRNEAIKKSTSEIIAVTDVGCILKKDWFEKLTDPFKKENIDVAAGFYKPVVENTFQKCLSTYTCTMYDQITDDFLPSSRSVAFKKGFWQKVDEYPENLDTCEDLVFARKLKRKGAKFKVIRSAIVFWPQRRNLIEAFWQFYSYAKGDGQARYVRFSTPFLYGRYLVVAGLILYFLRNKKPIILLILVTVFCLYIIWSIVKNYKYINNVKAILYLPLLQLTSDIAVLTGMTVGLMQ